jgi:uncharacterized membrane protein YadS
MATATTGGGAYALCGRSAARASNDVVNSATAADVDTKMIFLILIFSKISSMLEIYLNSLYFNERSKNHLAAFRKKRKAVVTQQTQAMFAGFQIL